MTHQLVHAVRYPRIFSVSCVGIIHHNNFDYLMHPFRTDVTGESGTGKSTIADILQLIFVGGKSHWKSPTPTKTDKKRTVEDLVLGKKQGYVFINAEIKKGKFLAFGVCIQRNAKQQPIQPFIIQHFNRDLPGNWDKKNNLEPFEKLLTAKHFLDTVQNIIVDNKGIGDYLEQAEFNYHSFSRKEYHQILTKNGLLPVDLSEPDEKRLANFASMLQSFARGELDITNSNSLKNFLFDDIAHDIKESYEEKKKDIETNHIEYIELKERTHTMREKRAALQDLLASEQCNQAAQINFYKTKTAFHYQQWKKAELDLRTNQNNLTRTLVEIQAIKFAENQKRIEENSANAEIIQNKLAQLTTNKAIQMERQTSSAALKPLLEDDVKKFEKEYGVLNSKKNDIGKVENWVKKIGNEVKLSHKFNEQSEKTKELERLSEILDELDKNKLYDDFVNSWYFTQPETAHDRQHQTIADLQNRIDYFNTLLPLFKKQGNSIVASLIDRGKPLSRQEEALFFHFMDISTQAPFKPLPKFRYIKDLILLLNNAAKITEYGNGFWWEYHGICEFVVYRDHNILDKTDKIQVELDKLKKSFAETLEELNIQLSKQTQLKESVHQMGYKATDVMLVEKRMEIQNYKYDTELAKQTPESFKDLVKLYKQSEVILQQYDVVSENYKNAITKQTQNRSDFEFATQKLREIEDGIKAQNKENETIEKNSREYNQNKSAIIIAFSAVKAQYYGYLPKYIVDTDNEEEQLNKAFKALKIETDKKINDIIGNLREKKGELGGKTGELQKEIERNKKAFERVEQESKKYLPENFEPAEMPVKEIDVEIAEKAASVASNEFNSKYHAIMDKYPDAKTDTRLKMISANTFNLAQVLLTSRLIVSPETLTSDLSNNVEQELDHINTKLQNINSNNAGEIAGLLSKIYGLYSKYQAKQSQINVFFQANKLTNERYVELSFKPSESFPIQWLKNTRLQIGEKLQQVGLFSQPNDKLTPLNVNDILIDLFKKVSKKQDSVIHIDELLNPKSYFNLSIDLKLPNGDSDSQTGGTGYGMIILICTARLALMNQANPKQLIKGLRYIAIDEVATLGENFELLRDVAMKQNFQIIIFSIDSIGRILADEGLYSYELRKPTDIVNNPRINPTPLAILHTKGLTEDDCINESHHVLQTNYQNFINEIGNGKKG